MVNTLGRGNHQPVTTGQKEMLESSNKRSTGIQPSRSKRKKTVQALTLAEPLVPSVLAALDNSDISEFSDAESDFTVDERTVSTCADKTNISERTVSTCADKTNSSERTVIEFFDKTNSSKSSRWDVDSLDLDLEQWKLNKAPKGKRPLTEVPLCKDAKLTYEMSLKCPALGPSAKPLEHKFVKRKNIVKR
jgi:hypothetical protein